MKILIDGRPSLGGVERYTRCLIRLLSEAGGDIDLLIFGNKAKEEPGRPIEPGPLRSLLGNARRILTDQLLLPGAARRERAEVIHSTNYFAPRLSSIPTVVTCHDLSLLDHFDTKKRGWMRSYERRVLISGLRRAAHVITPSKTVARRVREFLCVQEDKVTPLYPPLPRFPEPKWPPSLKPLAEVPFFLTVGTLEPRKNLARLLDAHQRAYKECRVPLYLAGAYGWRQEEVLRRIEGSKGAVRWLGYVEDATLAALYEKAAAVVACSLDEGFDYPTVEAMFFGVPVVLSDIPVHREVVGEMGLYAPANDPEALSEQLKMVAGWSAEERDLHRQRAAARLQDLQSESGAGRYLEVYRKVSEG